MIGIIHNRGESKRIAFVYDHKPFDLIIEEDFCPKFFSSETLRSHLSSSPDGDSIYSDSTGEEKEVTQQLSDGGSVMPKIIL